MYLVKTIALSNTAFIGVSFFLINFTLALGFLLWDSFASSSGKKMIWQILFEFLFYYPVALVGFLLLALVLYFLSLVFGGKGYLKQTLSLLGLSSFPIIFLFAPLISALAIIYWSILLIFILQKVFRYRLHSAVISVLIPFSVLFVLLYVAGLLNINPLLTTISSLL